MLNFDAWLRQPIAEAPKERELPEGITEDGKGGYEALCRCCERYKPLHWDISEVPMEGYEHWCGESPRCCP